MSKQNTVAQPASLADSPQPFVVGIGASAGGVEALIAFFEHVPAQSDMAFVVILHLSPDYDSQLAQILQTVTPLPVSQVTETAQIRPNQVYIVPPNRHLRMQAGAILVLTNTSQQERRAPVDIFFRTLAESHHARAIAVILSGTGANGSMGLKRIKEQGGAVFAQSPQQAAFAEMPRHAMATELVDEVLPVAAIPARLLAYSQKLGTVTIAAEADERPQEQQQALREVFARLRLYTGHDFVNYKRPTVLRRIERRIAVHSLPSLVAYAAFLGEHPSETEALLKDLLISVTNFFRDPAVFTALEEQVLSHLTSPQRGAAGVRIWVAGCATGEEAYSLAMLCAERTQGVMDAPKVQIFATDIDEHAITKAREGVYTLNDVADVAPDRLRRFFTQEGASYRVGREIREMVLFASHNVLKDPPFSRLDLITCRNLLIYFNHTAQERALETFHFGLQPGGHLLLGLSETADSTKDLYVSVNRELHLYQSRPLAGQRYPVPEALPALVTTRKPLSTPPAEGEIPVRMTYSHVHQRLLEQYAPPSVVVNEEYDLLHFTDQAGRFLHFSGGELSRNLLKLIWPELRLELRTALYQATQRQTNIVVPTLTVHRETQLETLSLHVRPVLDEHDPARGYFLILFESLNEGVSPPPSVLPLVEPLARHLEDELIRVKGQLRISHQQHEQKSEDLKASNEELQAMNEELRSAAEELETGKEELQSINEELTTVNQELKVKIDEVSLSSDNLRNLINSTHIATLFLDRGLRVNMFTPITREIFNLIPADYGRPLTDITHRLDYHQLDKDAQLVLATLQPQEREVSSFDGRAFMLQVLPYRTTEDRINGVVITLVDITRRKRAEDGLRESDRRKDEFLSLLAHELRNPVATLANALLLLEATGGTDAQLPLPALLPMMGQEVQYLRRLIDDLLDISRINLGKIDLRFQRLELTDLVRQVVVISRSLAEQGHQQLRLHLAPPPLYVSGDAVRLKQVLHNLLDNARKFTPAGGSIDLYVERQEDQAVVRLVDSGIGLTADELIRIFDRFAQVDQTHTRAQAGLGLGLTLVRDIVSLHQGQVEAQSPGLNQGSTFTFYLPLLA